MLAQAAAAAIRPTPGAPILEAVCKTSARVCFAAVPGDASVAVYMHDGSKHFIVNGVPFNPVGQLVAIFQTATKCTVSGLKPASS